MPHRPSRYRTNQQIYRVQLVFFLADSYFLREAGSCAAILVSGPTQLG